MNLAGWFLLLLAIVVVAQVICSYVGLQTRWMAYLPGLVCLGVTLVCILVLFFVGPKLAVTLGWGAVLWGVCGSVSLVLSGFLRRWYQSRRGY